MVNASVAFVWLLVTFLRISWTRLTLVTEASMTRWRSCLLVLSWCMLLAVVSVAIDVVEAFTDMLTLVVVVEMEIWSYELESYSVRKTSS